MGFEHEGPEGVNFNNQGCGQPAVRWEDAAEVDRWFEAVRQARTQTTRFASPSTAR
jgi:hypothetical protein